jgi:hypothetical protein
MSLEFPYHSLKNKEKQIAISKRRGTRDYVDFESDED